MSEWVRARVKEAAPGSGADSSSCVYLGSASCSWVSSMTDFYGTGQINI